MALLVLAALLLPSGPAMAIPKWSELPARHSMEIGFDLVILRPLGLVYLAIGAGAFVPVAFFSAGYGREGFNEARELFITTPVRDVIRRPLGEF